MEYLKNIPPNFSKRIIWVDWAKFILIYLVLLGHSNAGHANKIIYSFHMPCFFMISGFLCQNITLKKATQSGIRLLAAALIYNIVLITIYTFIDIQNHQSLNNLLPRIQGIFDVYYPKSSSRPVAAQFWFVYILIIGKIILALFKKIKHHERWLCSTIILIVLYLEITYQLNLKTYFYIDRTIAAFPFIALGYLLKKGINPFKNISVKKSGIGLLFLFSIVLFRYKINGIGMDQFHHNYGNSVIIAYIIAYCESILFFNLLQNKKTNPLLVYSSSNGTFFLLAIHIPLFIIIPVFNFYGGGLIISTIVLLCMGNPLVIGKIKKYYPILLGK